MAYKEWLSNRKPFLTQRQLACLTEERRRYKNRKYRHKAKSGIPAKRVGKAETSVIPMPTDFNYEDLVITLEQIEPIETSQLFDDTVELSKMIEEVEQLIPELDDLLANIPDWADDANHTAELDSGWGPDHLPELSITDVLLECYPQSQ